MSDLPIFRRPMIRQRQAVSAMHDRVLTICLFLLLGGCAVTVEEGLNTPDKPLIPPVRLAPDSVVLEVGLVDAPHDDIDWMRDVWSELDEQQFSPDVRRRLHANGLRVGTVGSQLPIKLREAIDARTKTARGILAALSEGEHAAQSRRIQTRRGKRSEIITIPTQPSMVVLMDDGDGVAGESYSDCQSVFAVRCFPEGDGTARIELTPEIQFGPQRQRYTGSGGMFQLEAGREKKVFDRMTFSTTLTPGQTLVVTTNGGRRSLGGNFFTTKSDQTRMLMIRLAHTQYEDLFKSDDDSESRTLGLTTELD